MIPPSWTRQPLRAKRTGSKRFLPKNTNGNGNTRIESNCRISVRSLECKRLIATVDLRYVNIARAKAGRSSSLQHTVDTVNSCTALDPVLDRGSISDQPLAEAIGKLLPS